MGHEISQFDISDRQLFSGRAQACIQSDIGEAKVSRTLFGGAKVRVIRERDRKIRAWTLGTLAVIAIVVAVWQGWIIFQESELAAPVAPLSERISVSAPVFQPENISPGAARSSGRSKTESLIQTEIDSLVASPNTLPQRPAAMTAANPRTAKTDQPLMTSNPVPATTASNPAKNPPNMQPQHSLPASVQSGSPAVEATPATHPDARKPAPVVAPAEPLSKNNSSTLSSAGNNQPLAQAKVEPVNARGTEIIYAQPQDNAKP